MLNESLYISYCIDLLEKKYRWGNHQHWGNQYFVALSNDIREATGKNISDSTLKRFVGRKKTPGEVYSPQLYTKNALAEFLGFLNWDHLIEQVDKQTQTSNKPSKTHLHLKSSVLWVLAGCFLVAISYWWLSGSSKQQASIQCTPSQDEAPFTTVFTYHLEKLTDSVLIDFGNNESILVPPEKTQVTQFYRHADYTTIRLLYKGQVLTSCQLHILSKGWQSGYSPNDSTSAFKALKNQQLAYKQGRLFLSPADLATEGIRTNQDFYTEYRYFDRFISELDELSFQTSVKNSPDEGGIICHDVEIWLQADSGNITCRFLDPKGFRYARIQASEVDINGRFENLQALGRDMTTWRTLGIEASKGKVYFTFDGDTIYKTDYKQRLGKLRGIKYRFFGCGSVDWIVLKNAQSDTIYSETFNNPSKNKKSSSSF